MVEKDRQLDIINPASMMFLFELSKGECHQELFEIRLLDRIRPDRSQYIGDESNFDFRPKLLKSLTSGKYPMEAEVSTDSDRLCEYCEGQTSE